MPTPLVSVIVPLYNAAATVGDTIRSVQAQTLRDWECLIVDDGSTDDGPAVVRSLAGADPRFRLVSQDNRGLAGARNTGLATAAGRYVHFLDSDDWIAPTALELLIAAADGSPCGAAAGAWELHDASGGALGRTISSPARPLSLDGLLDGNRIAPHSHVVRRDWFERERFDGSLRVVEDLDLWLRLAHRGLAWTPVEDTVAHYRVRPGSLSKNPRLMFDTHRDVLGRAYERLAGADTPVDHSPVRMSRSLRVTGLFYATNAALLDPDPLKTSAADLFLHATPDRRAREPELSPEQLGAGAAWSLMFGCGIGPATVAAGASGWAPALRDWWMRCASLGWTAAGGDVVQRALDSLAAELLDPRLIADSLLDAAVPTAPTVLIGLGQNGRIIARRAAARGIALECRDDRVPGVAPIGGSISPAATVLVSPAEDSAILPRLAASRRIVRWCGERARLAAGLAAPLREAFEVQAASSGSTMYRTPSWASR